MPTVTPETGTGTTIGFPGSGFSAPILTLGVDDLSRESLETTILTTATAKTFMPADLYDPGTIPITFQFKASEKPPVDQPVEVITLTFPVGTGSPVTSSTWVASGFMTDYTGVSIGHGIMEGSATLKITTDWTIATT